MEEEFYRVKRFNTGNCELYFLAYDSFSVRSMATYVKSKNIKIAIDPGIAIAPKRYGLPPTNYELEELENGRRRIIEICKDCDIVIVTHYHFDHHPHYDDLEFYEKVFFGKRIYCKNPEKFINKSQRNRAKIFLSIVKDKAEVIYSDSKSFEVISFSNPCPHGASDRLGYITMVLLNFNKKILFASDTQGILHEKTKEEIIEMNPDILITSGPPTYLLGYRLSKKDLEKSYKNFEEVLYRTDVKIIVIDHHLLRDINYKEYVNNLKSIARDFGTNIYTASESIGIEERLLEARRKEFFKYAENNMLCT